MTLPDVAVVNVAVVKVAVVTGAAGGIGAAVARRLTADGYRVACVDVSDGVEAVATELDGGAAFRCDVSSPAAVARLATEVGDWAGGAVSLLVNAAGGCSSATG